MKSGNAGILLDLELVGDAAGLVAHVARVVAQARDLDLLGVAPPRATRRGLFRHVEHDARL